MPSEVGSGQVAIYPTFKGFRKAVTTEVDGSTKTAGGRFTSGFRKVGQDTGKNVGTGFKKAFGDATKNVTSDTVAKIKTDVAAAARAVSAARLKEQDAAGKVRVAEAQLAEVRKKYASDSSQVIRAQERLSSATRSLGSAEDVAKSASDRLRSSQEQLKTATLNAQQAIGRSAGGFRSALSSVTGLFSNGGRSSGSGFLSGLGGILAGGAVGGIVASIASSVLGGVGNIIGDFLTRVQDAVVSAGKIVISFNSTIENATIGFTTMLGSGKKAKAFLDGLKKFALSTPFEFTDLVKNSQLLLGMGINAKDVIPDLTALGDSVASTGGSADVLNSTILAFAQTSAKGKLSMDNLNQLLQGGVPNALKILAAQFHTTTGGIVDLISQGKVASSVALPLLVKGIEKGTSATAGLGGMMDKQSKTFTGAVSNINDSVQQSLSAAFLPLFLILEKVATKVATFASSKQFQQWIGDVSAAIGTVFNADTLSNVQDFFAQIFGGDTGAAGAGLLAQIGPAFSQISGAVQEALPYVITFAQEVLPPLIAYLGSTISHTAAFIGFLGDISPALAPAGAAIGGAITFMSGFAGSVLDALGAVGRFVRNAVGFFGDLQDGIRTKLIDAVVAVAGFPARATTALGDLGSKLFRSGAALIGGFIDGIRSKVKPVTDAVKLITDAAARFFPQSPAKEGAFSGHGWTLYSGQATAEGFAEGLTSRTGTIRSASGAVMTAAALTGSSSVTTSAVSAAVGDRPIYMDGSLFGMLRQLANGEATIVLNTQNAALNAGTRLGSQGLTFG